MSIPSDPIYDVLIVGAGPVGLATALGLWRRGITNILVIDQAREFRKVGQVVDLLPNGLRAVKYLDPDAYESIKNIALNVLPPSGKQTPSDGSSITGEKPTSTKRRWCQRNMQGQVLRSFNTDFQSWFDCYGEGRISGAWFALQTALRNLLPPEKVQANQRCVYVAEDPGRVRVETTSDTAIETNPFAHWELLRSTDEASSSTLEHQESKRQSFSAKLVVAADGINSTIRQILYEHKGLQKWSNPQYSGFAAIGRMQSDNVPDALTAEIEHNYLQGERVVTLMNKEVETNADIDPTQLILFRTSENTLGYSISAPFSLEALLKSSPPEILNLGLKALQDADFLPIFLQLVGQSTPEKIFYRPYFLNPVQIPNYSQRIWSQGRVVLVGDAAHGMPPFLAQGANQGFEDAAVIVTLIADLIHTKGLDQKAEIATLFEKYEQIRWSFVEKIQFATMTHHQWTHQQREDFNEILYRRQYPSAETLGA